MGRGREYFPEIVEFSLLGMEPNQVTRQRLEAPGTPIVHTYIERPEAHVELTTFATNQPDEGRVDNVLLEISPRSRYRVLATSAITVRTKREIAVRELGQSTLVRLDGETAPLFFAVDSPLVGPSNFVRRSNLGLGWALTLKEGVAASGRPLRYFFRFPLENQQFDRIKAGLGTPGRLLAGTRGFWQNWTPFAENVSWKLPGRYNDFLVACARNILQHREVTEGKLAFQAGPTIYRGHWFLDGHFILEAARYLGHDAEAQQAFEASWARQEDDGAFFAGAGREHWMDTGIALFTPVRQAELSQDWSYFRRMQPDALRAVQFLMSLRDKARSEGSANGRYGLLARGMGDGGLGGVRSEFTNTLWALAGLRAFTEAAGRLGLSGVEPAQQFYRELWAAFLAAARRETQRHPAGFEYVPMLMREDPLWSAPNEWDRPRPQTGQWALSQAIYPGLVFEKNDPLVRGHIALMQACTQEDVPAETGWLPYQGLWTNNAVFVFQHPAGHSRPARR